VSQPLRPVSKWLFMLSRPDGLTTCASTVIPFWVPLRRMWLFKLTSSRILSEGPTSLPFDVRSGPRLYLWCGRLSDADAALADAPLLLIFYETQAGPAEFAGEPSINERCGLHSATCRDELWSAPFNISLQKLNRGLDRDPSFHARRRSFAVGHWNLDIVSQYFLSKL